MASAINEQAAYKLLVPAEPPPIKDESGQLIQVNATPYNKGVKYNYTEDDLNSLAEIIGYVKTLSCTILKCEEVISNFSAHYVYQEVQDFVYNVLGQGISSASKTNNKEAEDIFKRIINIFGDPANADHQSASKKKETVVYEIKKDRAAPISVNQLDHLRAISHSLKNGKLAKKSFGSKGVISAKLGEDIDTFINNSELYYALLNFAEMIRTSTNLGNLWFREIYVDMESVLQFPVRSSLPFILLEHILNTPDQPALHDSMLYPFEIYNDAAYMALNTFNSQYLYKEIAAEVSICVDMIAFTFADTFYKFCRVDASIEELPNSVIGAIPTIPMRYQVIAQQNKVQLLGTHIDFNKITTAKLNDQLVKEIQGNVELLKDFRNEPYVLHLMKVLKKTYNLLLERNLAMDDFQMLWDRAVGLANPLTLQSVLIQTIINSLDFQHYSFSTVTRRFRVKKALTLLPQTKEQWATVYADIHANEVNYIGRNHFKAAVELLNPGELAYLFLFCEGKLEEATAKMIEIYQEVAPKLRLLPSESRDTLVGFFNFSHDAYQSVDFKNLGGLYNSLRVIGNILAFAYELQRYINSAVNENITVTGNISFVSTLMEIIKQQVLNKKQFFITDENEEFNPLTLNHRTFTTIWSLMEFIFCTPESIKLNDKEQDALPMDAFGEGPIIAAHTIITLCNEIPLYQFDSIIYRALMLYEAEKSTLTLKPSDPLYKFIQQASVVNSVRRYVYLLAEPFKIHHQNQ